MSLNEEMKAWCGAYEAGIDEIVLANRVGDLGFNLYFRPAAGADRRAVAVRISQEQARGLLGLLQEGLENYDDDNGSLSGGCYTFSAPPQVDPPRPPSESHP